MSSLSGLMAFTVFCLTGLTAIPDAHHSFAMYDQAVTLIDSEAFVRPVHAVTVLNFNKGLDDAKTRHTYVECRVSSTIVNGPDGRPVQLRQPHPRGLPPSESVRGSWRLFAVSWFPIRPFETD